jgi:rfaE bifunctional protein nucleotidyltransferase chain/domain
MNVLTIDDLVNLSAEAQGKGLTVGLCHGCFDILHIGHIGHFTAARSQCDMLFVSVTANRYVNKGPDRPVIPELERAEIVSSLKVVAGAVINYGPTSEDLLSRVKPNFYFKGQEYISSEDSRFIDEREVCKRLGIELRHTFERVCSSSKIIASLHTMPDYKDEHVSS